jgi:predicted aspartyl protease
MLVVGKWWPCGDGVTRPVVVAEGRAPDGTPIPETFLVDTGADRTVFSATFANRLGVTPTAPPPGFNLAGIGGSQGIVVIATVLEFTRSDGGTATVRGTFAAFTDPAAADMSILGREVLDNFDVILSRRRNELLFLAPNHQYQVIP